jgi:FAD/FMN-containing dehydrogenase
LSHKEALEQLIKGEVKNDPETLHHYSGDASAFRIIPEVVVLPEDADDLKKLVGYVKEQKESGDDSVSLTPRSCGTDMAGGDLNQSIIVDVNAHMNHILDLKPEYAVVQPGLPFRFFEKETFKQNCMLPSYPASKSIASVGGMVANNSGGEKSLRYGKTERYVEQLKVILRDGNEYVIRKLNKEELDSKMAQNDLEGELYRGTFKLIDENYDVIKKAKPDVSKNSTGYSLWNVWDRESQTFDLTQLFVGSQGTLGIISEIKFRLVPTEKYSKMFVIYMHTLDRLGEIVNTMLEYGPTSIESYDDKTVDLAIRYFPELVLIISKTESVFKLGYELLPDLWIVTTHGFPKMVMMAEFTGDDESEIDKRMSTLQEALKDYKVGVHATKNAEESAKYWTIRRESFNLLRKKVKGKQTVPFIDDFIVKPAVMPQFLKDLQKIFDQYPDVSFPVAGHPGDGNFHIIPLMDMTDEKQRAIIPELTEKVFDLVLKYRGSLSAEHNDGLIRGAYLKQMYGETVFDLFARVKDIFDPHRLFNPHKKTDANLKYSMRFIKKDNEHSV